MSYLNFRSSLLFSGFLLVSGSTNSVSSVGSSVDRILEKKTNVFCANTLVELKIKETPIHIVGTRCDIDMDSVPLINSIQELLKNNIHKYRDLYVFLQGHEIKSNHTLSIDTSPYTGNLIIKIDFNSNSENGIESITKWFNYTKDGLLLEITSIQAGNAVIGKL